jgi:hypothetical protein
VNYPAAVYQAPTKYAQPEPLKNFEQPSKPETQELNINTYKPQIDTANNLDVPAFLRRRQSMGSK